MKKGLLIWRAPKIRKNIGDYIQSIAARQYTGNDVVFVEREETHRYAGEPIKMIMNGWFMHHPENWPPAEGIVPLFTSFHFNPAIADRLLSAKTIDYFKNYVEKYGPIGARDKGTEKILKSRGIDAYFSGCLTLTLGKTYQHNASSERVCFVDAFYEKALPKDVKSWITLSFLLLQKPKTIQSIARKLIKSTSLRNLLRAASFYRTYARFFEAEVLRNAEYIEHLIPEASFKDEAAKFACADGLLRKYANSKLVVTSRIHAALPCLAMGTPAIFVISDDLQPNGRGLVPVAKGRFEGLLELFHVLENMNYKLTPILGFRIEKKIGLKHTIRNKQKHLQLIEDLDRQCAGFIKDSRHQPSNAVL